MLQKTLPDPLPLSDIDIDIEFGFSQPKLNINVNFNVGERERVGKGMPQLVNLACYLQRGLVISSEFQLYKKRT